MQEEGYIAKIMFAEGTKDVPLGQLIAILVENKADIPAFANFSGTEAATPAHSTPAPAKAAPA
jgi:pyruvate dehydrogenase E2 component (dihydrolipoamide acetyltransferase)